MNEVQSSLRQANAFIFDFHGTLVKIESAAPPLWMVLNELGYRSSHELQAMWESDAFDGCLTPRVDEEPGYGAWRRRNLGRFARLSGVPDSLVESTVSMLLDLAGQVVLKPLPHAKTVLQLLRQHGKKLGLCSNWDRPVASQLEELGFPQLDAIAVSCEVGARKPNVAIFHDVCSKLSVEPPEAVLVGDSWSADVIGALRAGLTPVWLQGDQTSNPLPEQVVAFKDLSDMEAELKRIL